MRVGMAWLDLNAFVTLPILNTITCLHSLHTVRYLELRQIEITCNGTRVEIESIMFNNKALLDCLMTYDYLFRSMIGTYDDAIKANIIWRNLTNKIVVVFLYLQIQTVLLH